MIKCTILASGSKSNAIYVEVDKHAILLDGGLSYKQLGIRMAGINRNVAAITHVFVSHSGHGDHFSGVKMLLKKHPHIGVYGAGTKIDGNFNLKGDDNVYLDNSNGGDGSAMVTAFDSDHDVACLGFSVTDKDGNKLVYITDTGSIYCDSMIHMLDAGILIVESNHDVALLNKSPYPMDLQERVFQTHLENYQMRELVEVLKGDRLKYVALHHLSEQNNNPTLAEYEARAGLGDDFSHVKVVVAEQGFATAMMVLV